jgi:hypothetical protein
VLQSKINLVMGAAEVTLDSLLSNVGLRLRPEAYDALTGFNALQKRAHLRNTVHWDAGAAKRMAVTGVVAASGAVAMQLWAPEAVPHLVEKLNMCGLHPYLSPAAAKALNVVTGAVYAAAPKVGLQLWWDAHHFLDELTPGSSLNPVEMGEQR